ncbi:MAG: PH domain-containing protein [Arenimonas sp.]|nr:PH domain-containing protein [Arenimonas sp.]
MTDTLPAPADTSDDGWQPLPPAARRVAGIVGVITGLAVGVPLAIPVAVAMDAGLAAKFAAGAALWLLPPVLFLAWARMRWRRTTWRLDERGLQVRRGVIWRKEVLVPRSRVQHLDLERGPIERHFGLATLVVHTAGTRMHALRQSGFLDADAVALRDALLPEADRHDDSL